MLFSRRCQMSSPASIAKHPIHPMLVGLPIGLWVFSLICDVVRLSGGAQVWSTVAEYSIAGGIAGAILAAVPGFIDYLSIDEAEMKRIATAHLLLGLGALVIFTLDLWLRFRAEERSKLPFALSLLGVIATGIGGWLGGEMVYVKGMAVEAVEQLAKERKKNDAGPEKASRIRRAG
ncbi:MAG: DUF2231 domain-containing protein [Candidatus Sulfotelmatobacter sp.]